MPKKKLPKTHSYYILAHPSKTYATEEDAINRAKAWLETNSNFNNHTALVVKAVARVSTKNPPTVTKLD